MLETSKTQGVEALELDLRTSFMKKMMANQERTIIEQTIRFLRPLVGYYKRIYIDDTW